MMSEERAGGPVPIHRACRAPVAPSVRQSWRTSSRPTRAGRGAQGHPAVRARSVRGPGRRAGRVCAEQLHRLRACSSQEEVISHGCMCQKFRGGGPNACSQPGRTHRIPICRGMAAPVCLCSDAQYRLFCASGRGADLFRNRANVRRGGGGNASDRRVDGHLPAHGHGRGPGLPMLRGLESLKRLRNCPATTLPRAIENLERNVERDEPCSS